MESGEGQGGPKVIDFTNNAFVKAAVEDGGQVVGIANEDGSNPRQVFDGSVGIPVEMPQKPVRDENDPGVLKAVRDHDAAKKAAQTRRINQEAREHAAQFPDED